MMIDVSDWKLERQLSRNPAHDVDENIVRRNYEAMAHRSTVARLRGYWASSPAVYRRFLKSYLFACY